MEKREKKNKLTALLILAFLLIIGLTIGLITSIKKTAQKEEQIAATEVFLAEEKKLMANEMEQMAGEMDGYTIHIHNDSLLREFDLQKTKIKELQHQLKQTNNRDAKKITELKNEIASLRKILQHYIVQIDSLNSLNRRLQNENIVVKQKFQTATETVEQLSVEKENLNQVVDRASILETYNFRFIALNRRERKTKRANKMKTLQFDFTIGKNITATPGMKIVYLRLTRPDGAVMTKNDETFPYENKNISYSLKKEIEYTGQAQDNTLYWKVEEILQIGDYNADFFIDGNRIGNYLFRIEKK